MFIDAKPWKYFILCFNRYIYFLFVYVYMYIYMCSGTCTGQKRASDFLALQLQMIVNFQAWVLGPKLAFSTRTVSILNSWAISPVLNKLILNHFLALFVCICTYLCGVLHASIHTCQDWRTAGTVYLVFKTKSLTDLGSPHRVDWMASEPQRPSCLCLPRPGIINMNYHHVNLFAFILDTEISSPVL